MALSAVQRSRIILDLIKDGDTTAGDAAYVNLDMASVAIATKYGQSVWDAYGPEKDAEGVPIPNATSAQLAQFFLKQLRLFIRGTHSDLAGKVAAAVVPSAITTAQAEADTDLGTG